MQKKKMFCEKTKKHKASLELTAAPILSGWLSSSSASDAPRWPESTNQRRVKPERWWPAAGKGSKVTGFGRQRKTGAGQHLHHKGVPDLVLKTKTFPAGRNRLMGSSDCCGTNDSAQVINKTL